MASSVVVTIETEKSQSQAGYDLKLGADKDRENVKALENWVRGIRGGQHRAKVSIQTGANAPVSASGTWTLATVIATDAASLAGQTFTFSAGAPATENDVNVTVGSAKAFASATDISILTGAITETTHGYLTGDVVQMSTSDTLPTGFAASTDYWVIKVDADSYKLASTYANALASAPIVPSAVGVGNQTVTPNDDKSLAVRLAAAVNAHSVTSLICSASASGAVVTVTCHIPGIIGNYIAFSDADATITSSGSGFLADGAGGAQEAVQTSEMGL